MPALIFDFDGLMIDSERVLAEAAMAAMNDRGAGVTFDDIGHLFGATDLDHIWEEMLSERCRPPLTMAQFEDLIWPTVTALVDELPLLPGVAELIAAAQHHEWNIGIGTGQHRATVEQRLARLGVLDSFDAIVTVHDVGRSKPAPDIFLAVAARLGVDHAECYVLEDSLPGCEAALAAGMNLVICPSVVSASLPFPDHVVRVASLLNVTLDHERLVASSPR